MENQFSESQTFQTKSESGSAMIIAILVLLLLMGFVAFAISRTTNETLMTSNDAAEARTFAAGEASLENTTREFVNVFEQKLSPSDTDLQDISYKIVPGFDNYTFYSPITKTQDQKPINLTGGTYSGLYALRDSWQIEATATEKTSDVQVQLRRRFFSDRIPIFQFGVFYDGDLELNRPPLFTFGGRVHTNGNFFVTGNSGAGVYFNSKVTAAGEIVNDIWKPGTALVDGIDNQGKVFVTDSSGVYQELLTGEASVTCLNPVGLNVFAYNTFLPNCAKNDYWMTQKEKFQGNLEAQAPKLNFPLSKLNVNLIEIIKRGKNVGDVANTGGIISPVTNTTQDSKTVSKEKFVNKPGLRISLSDSQPKLPGCANILPTVPCGVRLDAPLGSSSIGYQPLAMTDGYTATALNATRMAMTGREVWIKVELVSYDFNTETIQTSDVTQDILSLGLTEPAPIGSDLQISGYTAMTDSRSIIKLQRFTVPGETIPNSGSTKYTSDFDIGGFKQNFVVRYKDVTTNPAMGCLFCTLENDFAPPFPASNAASSQSQEDAAHLKWANIRNSGFKFAIVPFPIQMFDSREGLANDDANEADSNCGLDRVPAAGVMSLVDIDVANLRRFLNGSFDGTFPLNTPFALAKTRTLRSTDVPNANGWVVSVSDRRGDFDFDGEYDMEDVFPDGFLQFNEDVNKDGILETDFGREAASYTNTVVTGQAATADHLFYRRGVRLINGSVLPGNYNSLNPSQTKGFTFASENGVYVKGNYNATGAGVVSGVAVTPAENYSPQNSATHIPAAIAGDAVMILSNNWNDGKSFASPFRSSNRVASDTIVRFAMISGSPMTGHKSFFSPSQFGQLNGGVHNFKRYLETWSGKRLNYSGSLINIFNSQNNNGFFKCCTTTYVPPIRDWTFDPTFLDANRLPPGTPFIYSISFTGFQRVND